MPNDFERPGPQPTCHNNICPAIGYQDVLVCLPVEVKPFADVKNIKTQCLGNPMIRTKCHCPGKPNATCKFTITQKIRVEVPVVFGAKTEVGGAFIDCECSGRETPPSPHGECDCKPEKCG